MRETTAEFEQRLALRRLREAAACARLAQRELDAAWAWFVMVAA